MDTIKAELAYTEYWVNKHFCIFVNNERLDKIVNRLNQNIDAIGLIPTLLPVLKEESCDSKEFKIVWERIFPKNNYAVCPILMCPEDIGFDCTLIVVEIIVDDNIVTWNRMGIDKTNYPHGVPELVGGDVLWFSDFKALEFSKEEYRLMVDTFKNDLLKEL